MKRETLIQPMHLERLALVYVRQSTPGQVLENRESTRLQYRLRERAEQLGWPRERIQTIDEDLGCSGSGEVKRAGFARLLRAVARGRAGAVFGLDASRFARNGAEWFKLLRWLRATETLLVTDEGVYDANSGDDSFVLGIHGALSEAELYRIKARMDKGVLNKARRGELYMNVPTGFVVDGKRLRKDPDRDVREAVGEVFRRFRELGTARQVTRQLRAEGLKLPTRHRDERGLEWREATYSRVWNVLRNPAMGGAYAWGRTRTKLQLDERDRERKTSRKLPMEEWRVLLKQHHEGYVEWEEWLAIQARLAGNAVGQGGRGAAREGRALLQGLATCGGCGRQMSVRYASAVQYRCAPGQNGEGGLPVSGGRAAGSAGGGAVAGGAGAGGGGGGPAGGTAAGRRSATAAAGVPAGSGAQGVGRAQGAPGVLGGGGGVPAREADAGAGLGAGAAGAGGGAGGVASSAAGAAGDPVLSSGLFGKAFSGLNGRRGAEFSGLLASGWGRGRARKLLLQEGKGRGQEERRRSRPAPGPARTQLQARLPRSTSNACPKAYRPTHPRRWICHIK